MVARWLSEEVQLVPMFNEVLPLAQHTCSFAARLFRNAREGVALGTRPRELMEVRKLLDYNSLLMASNGTTPYPNRSANGFSTGAQAYLNYKS